MADDTVEVRLVATDDLTPVFNQAAANVASSLNLINAGTNASAQAWRGMLSEIDGAEDTFVNDLIARRETLSQSLLDMAARLVETEIANDLKYFTNYEILSALQLDTDRLNAQSGLLVHLLTEATKTDATVEGVAARNAAEAAGNATSVIGTVANALKAIGIDAAQTFAGVFAFLAPVMGPAAVGPAAASEAAVYAAAGSIAAFDVGAWNVPQDMMGIIHAGETIMPADFASGYRSAAGGDDGAPAGGGSLNINMSVQALDARGVKALLNDPTTLRGLARNLQAYLTLNPSLRGAY